MRSTIFLASIAGLIFSGSVRAQEVDPARFRKAIERFEAADEREAPPRGAVLFVGSSSIRMWKLEESFPDLVTINRGFGGSHISDSIAYSDRIVLGYAPSEIVLYAGDNDIAGGKAPDRVFRDFEHFVELVHAKQPETPIHFLAIKPSIARWKLVEKMRQANQLIREVCDRSERLEFIDIDTPMIGEDGKPRAELFIEDGLHLSKAGYELWASVLRPKLRAALPDADGAVDYARDVAPILEENCARCHLKGRKKGGLQLDSREQLLAGGKSGAVVVSGDGSKSRLLAMVAGLAGEKRMPPKGDGLNGAEVDILRRWIDQGLAWSDEKSAIAKRSRALRPRRMPLGPLSSEFLHPIDRFLASYYSEHDVDAFHLVDDATFARRVFFDTIGVPPKVSELESFLADTREDKRRHLVRRLLADSSRYADHWLSFWNDALRNDYRGTGYIDGGRRQITDWLYRSLYENKPYDEFVRELIDPVPGSEGFTQGIVWRGTVNAIQVPAMQAAQNVSQVFLGLNLKCASCHDSFISDWELEDAYGLANIFSEEPLEIHRCNKPTGRMAPTRFLWPELGSIDADTSRKERVAALARILTSPENARLPRTIVNRLWAQFFGRGLIEPVDEMEGDAWSVDLLDWLASRLVLHDWDLRDTIEHILLSNAYQLPSVGAAEDKIRDFVFRGPLVRRLSAEQYVDALGQLTRSTGPLKAPSFLSARVLENAPVDESDPHRSLRFKSGLMRDGEKEVEVELQGARTLWLLVTQGPDGKNHDWANWVEPRLVGKDGEKRLTELKWIKTTNGHGPVRIDKNTVEKPLRIAGKPPTWGLGVHAHSVIIYDIPAGYDRFRARVGPDQQAIDEGKGSGHSVEFFVLTDVQVRSSLTNADALTRALGRPNREQVVTRRPSAATTLQALELTNGKILDQLVAEGAKRWLSDAGPSNEALIDAIWRAAMGRKPNAEELAIARSLVGEEASAEGVSDLLWAITMLPEFQLIH